MTEQKFSNYGKDKMLDSLGITEIALFDPDGVAIDSPQPITFNAAVDGVAESTGSVAFSVTAGTTVYGFELGDTVGVVVDFVFDEQVEYEDDGVYTVGIITLDLNATPT